MAQSFYVAVEFMVTEATGVKTYLVHEFYHWQIGHVRIMIVVGITCPVVSGTEKQHVGIYVSQTVNNVGETWEVEQICMHVVDCQYDNFFGVFFVA